MDEHQLIEEGIYSIFGASGARTEMPGCSLCMGNQARVAPNSTVVSTSTRNFPNRLGQGANVYLASSELAAVSAALGKIPTMDEYMSFMDTLNTMSGDIYRYLNFHEIESFMQAAERAKAIPVTNVKVVA
jgi:aconitate hydratase 2/2-methylisocitrate dehydratase